MIVEIGLDFAAEWTGLVLVDLDVELVHGEANERSQFPVIFLIWRHFGWFIIFFRLLCLIWRLCGLGLSIDR